MIFLRQLAQTKTTDPNRKPVPEILRYLSQPGQAADTKESNESGELPAWATIFRGMVIAGRLLAICTKPHCDKGKKDLVRMET